MEKSKTKLITSNQQHLFLAFLMTPSSVIRFLEVPASEAIPFSTLFYSNFFLAIYPISKNISVTLTLSRALVQKKPIPNSSANLLPSSKLTYLFEESLLFPTSTLTTSLEACILICFTQFQISLKLDRSSMAYVSMIPMAPRQYV